MDTTKAQQKALDDALVAPENRLKIGKCNQRFSPTLKSNEPTIQVALDALKLTPFYNAFKVSANVPKIYMQEFWATVTKHHFSLRFKMNGKNHTVNVDNFRDMLKICLKLPGQKFEDPLFEEEILSFIRDLRHTGEIKVLSNVNVNHLHQPWRLFAAIINKCLSGKTTALESLRLFTNSHCSSQLLHVQGSGNTKEKQDVWITMPSLKPTRLAVLMLNGEKSPKPKSTKKKLISESSPKTNPTKALNVSEDCSEREQTQTTHLHASGSGTDKGTSVTPRVPDVPSYDSEAEQISWKSSDEEDDDEVNMGDDNDDDVNNQDDDGQEYDEQDDDIQDDDDQEHDEQDDEEQDDVNEQTDSDNDGDDFVHPKLSTHDEEDKEEEELDPRVHTPSTDDEESDEEIQGANVEGEEMDEEETNEEDEANELYRDVNVNLEGRDTEMTDAPRTIVQTTQVIEYTHVIITPVNPEAQQQSSSMSYGFVSNMLNPSPDTGIDSIFNLNTKSTSLIDVLVTTIAETFKTVLEEKCDIPAAQQRLIYKGLILIDDQTLKSYGWRKKLEAAYPGDGEERSKDHRAKG
ncbi:retrovirus-related pol polyprotein from transposon TNT 1-94 [Tanacetum coccineum]